MHLKKLTWISLICTFLIVGATLCAPVFAEETEAINGENAVPITEEEKSEQLKCIDELPWTFEDDGLSALAASQIIDDEQTVKDRLSSIQTNQYPNGASFTETFYGANTCFGFAKKIQYLLFGNIVSWNYDGSANSGLYTVAQTGPTYTASNVEALLANAEVGDLLQLQNGNGYSQHSMIYGGKVSGGFIIYDANWEPNTVTIRTVSYSTFSNRQNPRLSLLRNTNYPKKAINDNTPPTVSNAKISEINSYSYKVSCDVSDDVGVKDVSVAVWTEASGQDDLKWVDATVSGNTATATIYLSDHNYEEGTYITHIYAYDYAGRQAGIAAPNTLIDYTPPVLTNTRFTATSTSRFLAGGTVTDALSGVARVEVTTKWGNHSVTENATIDGSTWTYHFNFKEHQATSDYYYLYITAYDQSGNATYNWYSDLSGYFEVRDVNHTVRFDSQGGSSVASQSVLEDALLNQPKNPTRSGYVFKGWYKEKDCTSPWSFAADRVDKDCTLYAKWFKIGGLGDINADGEINASDALQALRHSVKEIALSGTAFTAGDVNVDKKINATDALQILRYSVKEINTF